MQQLQRLPPDLRPVIAFRRCRIYCSTRAKYVAVAFVLITFLNCTSYAQSRMPVESEAANSAFGVVQNLWLRQGADYWISYRIAPSNFPARGSINTSIIRYVQAQNLQPKVVSTPLTFVDRTNGVEWKGVVHILAEATREYEAPRGWYTWTPQPDLMIFDIEKRDGQWMGSYRFLIADGMNPTFHRPQYNEISALETGIAQLPPSLDYNDPQTQVSNIINQSLTSINECYRGMNQYFNDDFIGWALRNALSGLSTKILEPNGLCDQYVRGDLPVDISIPVMPGVSIDVKKLCPLLQNPRCR